MGDLSHDAAPRQGQRTLLTQSSARGVTTGTPPRPRAGVPLSWSWWGPAAPGAPRAWPVPPTSNSMATELPVPVGTRGHWDPVLAAGSGLGLAGGTARLWAVQGQGHQPRRQSWSRQAGLYLTHVHKYSSGGRNGCGEGLCCSPKGPVPVVSVGSFMDHVQGSPGGRWGGPPVMERLMGILHTTSWGGEVLGMQRRWGLRRPAPLWGRWQGVPILPCGTSAPHSTWMSQICVGRSSAVSQMMAWSRS